MSRDICHCPVHGEYMEFGPFYDCPQCHEILDEQLAADDAQKAAAHYLFPGRTVICVGGHAYVISVFETPEAWIAEYQFGSQQIVADGASRVEAIDHLRTGITEGHWPGLTIEGDHVQDQ